MLFTRFNHSFRLLLLVLSTLIIVSCGSGDGESSVSDTPLTGLLLDGPVKGATYSSETQAGITKLGGEFKYFPNETIVFSIGGIKLGQVTLLKPSASGAQAIVTPVELTGSEDASDPKVIRLLQFLQSLDRDGDHSNGILISPATAAAAASIFLDFSDPDFDTNNPTFSLQALVDQIAAPADPTPEIVSATVALENFATTIQDNNLDISLSPTFQLAWSDEFNATTLNTDDWNFETGYGPPNNADGWGNDEWQLYTENSENLSIVFGQETDPANGYLRISALCPSSPSCGKRTGEITSAKINTKDKQEFQFGRIEARIKVPTGKGAWPAFWSLGAAYPETPWPAAGEIDFMEVFSVDNETTKDGLFTIHWEETDGEGDRQFTTSSKSFDGSSFHIFEAEWSNDRIIGRIDRVEFANYPIDPATQSELLNPFYLILNVAMGGNPVPGLEPDATTPWPQEMLVDYIRVYQAVAGLNNDILNINFEDGPSKFVCFEAGAGCGGDTGFAGGDAAIQPNPETAGINPSANAGRFLKFNPGNGEAFGGTLVRLTEGALDFAASNEIFTMKVYSTRAVPVLFELADSTPNDGGIGVTAQHTGNGWEELEFDFTGLTAGAARTDQIVLIFDNGVVGDAEGDPANWTFYFDDIVLQKLPPVTGGGLGDTDGDFGDGSSDGTGFGVFSETNTTTAVSNSSIASEGNTVVIDAASTAVTPFDGSTVLALTYSDNTEGNFFGGGVIQFDSADVSAFNTLKFSIDAASFTGLADLTVQLEPPGGGTEGGNVALAAYTPVAVLGNWKTYEIPLADFSAVNPASITKLGFFNARDGSGTLLAGTLYLDDIHFTVTGGGGGTGGTGLPFSDDFESGDLAGWTPAPNGGSITADNTQAGGGTFSARLVAGPSQAPALSIEGLAAGSVAPNDTIDVSWDMCGSFAGSGEVMFPALISERGDGSGGERVFDTIASVPAVWTRFTRSFTADSNTANLVGGVSVQFDVVCGGDAGCAADVFIDNVDITNGGGDPGGPASGASCAGGGGGNPGSDVTLFADDFATGWVSFLDANGTVTQVTDSDATFGEVLELTTGGSTVVGIGSRTGDGSTIDTSAFATLEFDLKLVTAPPATTVWKLKTENPGVEIDIATPVLNTWVNYSIPLSDLGTPNALDLILLFPNYPDNAGAVFRIDNVKLVQAPPPPSSDVTLFADDFATGWVSFLDANGTVTQVTDSDATFGEVLELTTGGSTVVGIGSRTGDGSTIDTSAFATLEFDLKLVTAPPATTVWKLKTENPGVEIDIATPVLNTWVNYSIPLSDLGTPNALDLILLFPNYPDNAGAVFRIDNVKLVQAPPPPSSDVTLFADDFATGWVSFLDANGTVTQVTDSDATFGEVLELTTGGSTVVGIGSRTGDGSTIDTSAFATLEFDLKLVTAPPATTVWKLKTENPGVEIDIATPVLNTWVNYSIPLSDLGTPNALDLILLFPNYPDNAGAVFRIDNVKLVAGGGGTPGAELVTNGDFETNGLENWLAITDPNGGTIMTDTVEVSPNNSSATSIKLTSGPGNNPVLKQERFAVSSLTANASVTVSFDIFATLGIGSVLDVALITEGASAVTENLVPQNSDWQSGWATYSFTTNVGSDVSGGISLQFVAIGGGGTMTLNVDNVSIILN